MANVDNLIRIGQVSSVNPAAGTVRVAFDDLDKMVSYDLPVLAQTTVNAKQFAMPEVGEHVLCAFLPSGMSDGFVIGAYYTQGNQPKGGATGIYRTEYSDGTAVEYDLNTHTATVRSEYAVNVECKDATVKATETLTIDGKNIAIKASDSIVLSVSKMDGTISISTGSPDGTISILGPGGVGIASLNDSMGV